MSDYKTFMKHAEKVTKSEATEGRPVLKGIMHYEDGSAAVTDSHRLYRVKDIHDKSGCVLSPTGKKIEGNYPEVKRLIPSNDPEYATVIDVNEFIKGVDIIRTAAKAAEGEPVMKLSENKLSFDSINVKAGYNLDLINGVPMQILSNAQYWLDALQMFKAFKYDRVILNLYSPVRPFTLISQDVRMMALILPVRRF